MGETFPRAHEGDARLPQIVEREAHGGVAVRRRRQQTDRLVERRDGVPRGITPGSSLVEGVEDRSVDTLERARGWRQIDRSPLRAALQEMRRATEPVVGALQVEHPLGRPRLSVAPHGSGRDGLLGGRHLG